MSGSHPSYKSVRYSDASTFDFICDDCGARDEVPGGWGRLAEPCTNPRRVTMPRKFVCDNCGRDVTFTSDKGVPGDVKHCPFCGSEAIKQPGQETVQEAAERGFYGKDRGADAGGSAPAAGT